MESLEDRLAPAVLNVPRDMNFITAIGTALRNEDSSNTILVAPGIYEMVEGQVFSAQGKDLTVSGTGPGVIFTANQKGRVMVILGDVTLENLTITGGQVKSTFGHGVAPNGAGVWIATLNPDGGGAPILPEVTFDNVVIEGNTITGYDGANATQAGAGGGSGGGVMGGGIYVQSGSLTMFDTIIRNNRVIGGAGGAGGPADPNATFPLPPGQRGSGGSARGGGVYIETGANVTGQRVAIENNQALEGQGGPTAPSPAARGGGIALVGGTLTLFDSTVDNNQAVGNSGSAAGGGASVGQSSSRLILVESSIRNNKAVSAGGSYLGGSALGGALYQTGGSVEIYDGDVSNSKAIGGPGGNGENGLNGIEGHGEIHDGGTSAGGKGGDASGGGIYVSGGSLAVIHASIVNNAAIGGTGGRGGAGGDGVEGGEGGVIYQRDANGNLIPDQFGNPVILDDFGGGRGGAGGDSIGGRGGNAAGGGLYVVGQGVVTLSGTTFNLDVARGGEGGTAQKAGAGAKGGDSYFDFTGYHGSNGQGGGGGSSIGGAGGDALGGAIATSGDLHIFGGSISGTTFGGKGGGSADAGNAGNGARAGNKPPALGGSGGSSRGGKGGDARGGGILLNQDLVDIVISGVNPSGIVVPGEGQAAGGTPGRKGSMISFFDPNYQDPITGEYGRTYFSSDGEKTDGAKGSAGNPGLENLSSTTPGAQGPTPTKLDFSPLPPAVGEDAEFPNPVYVVAKSATGRVAGNIGAGIDSIFLNLASAPQGSKLSGVTSVSASYGVALFNTVSIDDGTGSGFTLGASSLNLSGTSESFQVKGSLVVNSLGDAAALIPAVGPDTDAAQPGDQVTLRSAIQFANTLPGPATIRFNLQGVAGYPVIAPTSPLPPLTSNITLDGLNLAPTMAVDVELDGSRLGVGVDGLVVKGAGSTLRRLIVVGFLGNGVVIEGTNKVTLTENRIGVDQNGQKKANFGNGVELRNSESSTVGGINASDANVISGNALNGILIIGNNSRENRIQGNLIGTTADGRAPLSNNLNGVLITDGAHDNKIGSSHVGDADAAGNLIAFNGGAGVLVGSDPTKGFSSPAGNQNTILSNVIHSNATLGIVLGPATATTRPNSDLHSGPNLLQNYPEISPLIKDFDGSYLVHVSLSGPTSFSVFGGKTYIIQVFANVASDSSQQGGHSRLILSQTIVTDDLGFYANTIALPGYVRQAKEYVTGTATDALGNTSELSIPRAPVLFVPGIGGSMPSTSSYVNWLFNRGVDAEALLLEPLSRSYDDTIQTLLNAGYVLGDNLLKAVYDWRLPVGPSDGNSPGFINGINAAFITSEYKAGGGVRFTYGVDYLGYWLATAVANWNIDYPGVPMPGVDIICHSTGGLVVRTYIQSAAYNGQYVDQLGKTQTLPKINNLLMMGVPNAGAAGPYQVWADDDWSRDAATFAVLRTFFNDAYQKVLTGQTIRGADQDINLASITDNSRLNPRDHFAILNFIHQYCPTFQILLPSYASYEINTETKVKVFPSNGANPYLATLNADQIKNPFTNKIGHLYDIYGIDQDTATFERLDREDYVGNSITGAVNLSDGFGLNRPSQGKYIYLSALGDGTVPTFSAFPDGSAGSDPNINFTKLANVTPQPFKGISHTGMFADPRVGLAVLHDLGGQINPAYVSTDKALLTLDALGVAKVTTISGGTYVGLLVDPVDAYLIDANGKRLGYTAATGVLTEIPGSQYYGGANGFGIINGPVAQPLQLVVIGDGGTPYVSVFGNVGNTSTLIQFNTPLSAGQQTTVEVPFQTIPAPIITAVSQSGPQQGGGAAVVITGNNFLHTSAVLFGTVQATEFSIDSDTQITAIAPTQMAGTLDIRVVDLAAGASAISAADQFTYSLSGTVFRDDNNNGQRESGEPGLEGQIVYLDVNHDGVRNAGDVYTTTADDGLYSFTSLTPGSYIVRQVVADGYVLSAPASGILAVTIAAGTPSANQNFADRLIRKPTSTMTALPLYSRPRFTVSWSGMDIGGPDEGKGIASYDIFVSDNGGAFTVFLTATQQTSAIFTGLGGHTYSFYSVATDLSGFRQPTPSAAQATTQALLDTSNKQYVDAVYQDLLGRSPDLTGLNFWSAQLDQGISRDTLIDLIDHSAEYFGTIIKPAYQKFLGRTPDESGLAYWIDQMANHSLTDERLEAGFIGSSEYYTYSGGTAKSWVDAMYLNLLGRLPDPAGEDFWVGQLAGGADRAAVAYGFAASEEREKQHIVSIYQKYLGRLPDEPGLNYWLDQFLNHGLTNENLITGFVSSDEYYGKRTAE